MADKPLFKVKEERITITVPHQSREITFVAPSYGPGTYNEVGEQIDKAGLLRPTFAETVSLVHSAVQNRDNKYTAKIIKIYRHHVFWGFNDLEKRHNEGVLISGRNRNICVPFGYKKSEHALEKLVKNPFVLALAEGKEGAEKLAEIAESCNVPWDWYFEDPDFGVKGAACLSSNGDGYRLTVLDVLGGDYDGYAYGLQKD